MSNYLSVRPNLAKALADAIAATDEDLAVLNGASIPVPSTFVPSRFVAVRSRF